MNKISKCKATAQKIKFSIKFPADLVAFTEEILNAKLHFLCSERFASYLNAIKKSE